MTTLTYVVTGASRGLGLEFVTQLSSKGHTVFALARNPDASERLQKLVDNKKVFSVKIDTNCEDSIKTAAEKVAELSPEGIDVLINNAGVSGTRSLNPETTSRKDYIEVFETNIYGVSDTTQAFLPLLRKRGEDKVKKIVNISSILGSIGAMNDINPSGNMPAYNVSKAALNMLTKNTANYLAKENFIVYSSHPGWVKTDMGGDSAPVEIKDSIAGQLSRLDTITAADNGGFFDFQGKALLW